MAEEKESKHIRMCAGAFIFNEEKKFLLVKQNDKYKIVGGGIEYGEGIEQALVREVQEEVGLKISDIKFYNVVDGVNYAEQNHGTNHFIFLNHIAYAGKQTVRLSEEFSAYRWNTLEDWLKLDKNKFVPMMYDVLKELKDYVEKEDYEYKYKRALADYQNLLKQTATEKQEFAKYANEQLITEIIPVYDNMKMSLDHFSEDSPDKWLQGIKYVIKQFKDVLSDLGVEEIETKGKKFDPHTMEALEGEGLKVKKQVRSGYKLKGKIIIPAKVILE